MTQPLQQFPLRLRLLRGRHLRRADWTTGESDPYAEVWLAEGGQKQRTRVATNTRNPLWNHDFSFTLTAGEADTLHVQVYDEDIGKRDELLGEVAIPVAKLTPLPLVSWGGGGGADRPGGGGAPAGGGGAHTGHTGAGHAEAPPPPPPPDAYGQALPLYPTPGAYPPPGPGALDAYGRQLPPHPPLGTDPPSGTEALDAYGRPVYPQAPQAPPDVGGGWSGGAPPAAHHAATYPPPPHAPSAYRGAASSSASMRSAPCAADASSGQLPAGAAPAKASRRSLSSSLAGVTGKMMGLASDHLLGVPKEEGGPLRSARSASGGRVHGVPTKPPPPSSGGVDEHHPHFFAEAFSAHHADTPLLSDALLDAGYTAAWHALTPERSGEVAIAIGPPATGGAGGGAGAPGGGDPPSLPIPIPFQVYNASLLTKVAASFPTYTLQVHSVASVFGDARCAWNRSYRPAQQIFASGPQALMARSLIRAQHARLCGGGLVLDDGLVSSLRRAFAGLTGAAASAAEFFALTHHGVRGGKSRFFTYVLLAGDRAGGARLRFSETGASFWADVRSKHAVHSNAAAEVVYSGEFHIRTYPRGGEGGPAAAGGGAPRPPTLVMDNGSGTYAPDKARLPLLREVLRRNFPDMAVEVVDFQGPVVAAAKEAIKLHGII